MMISTRLAKAMSEQVGQEFVASIQYLAVAAYFDREQLPQLAAFFYRQSDEERDHALKIAHYVTDAGGMLELPAIAAPRLAFASAEEAFEGAIAWETDVTRRINALVKIAREEQDYLADNFLRWFVDEQLEEVTTMEMLARAAKRAGGNLLLLEGFVGRMGSEAD
jgi:ferritin